MAQEYKVGITPEALKGTKTEQNLHTALAGESQAYIRYKIFESKAKQDGFVEISQIFCETAENEKEHAEIWFRYLGGWSDTNENLKSAASGEHYEWSSMYAQFADEAKAEGFDYLAGLFGRVASIEKMHEERYNSYHNALENKTLLKSDDSSTKWICLNCGYVVTAKEPPQQCPVCQAESGHYKKLNA